VKEEEIVIILNNTVPFILNGENQSVSVEIGQIASFVVETRDEDGDNLNATLVRSDPDFGLYKLSTISSDTYGLSFAGSELDGTFKAQVSVSDGKTPVLFTASVKVLPPSCENDRSFRYKGKKNKSCIWVGDDPVRRNNFCSRRKTVRDACRMTCGLCCKDDSSYRYTIRSGLSRDCAWAAKKDSRSRKVCTKKKVRSNCPITCASCQDKYACVNNNESKINVGKGKKTCAWIGRNNARRFNLCAQRLVRIQCPTTCGLCCENDPVFTFTSDSGKKKNCAWIAKQVSRKEKYCPQEQISSRCPEETACNSCQSNV